MYTKIQCVQKRRKREIKENKKKGKSVRVVKKMFKHVFEKGLPCIHIYSKHI